MTAPEWAVEKAARGVMASELCSLVRDSADCAHMDDSMPCRCDREFTVCQEHDWEEVPAGVTVCAWAERIARAALDAVWPETTTEWGVRFEDGFVKSWRGNEQAARRHEREVRSQPDDPGVLVAREVGVTEWREVQP